MRINTPKILGLIAAAVCCLQGAKAQQRLLLSQYSNNTYFFNPASAGSLGYGDLKVGFRKQYVGVPDGPLSFYASYNVRLGTQAPAAPSISLPIRTRAVYAVEQPAPISKNKGFHALGGNVSGDQTGPFSNYSAYVSYAYSHPLYKTWRLAAGASVGLIQYYLDKDKLNFTDQVVGTGINSNLSPDVTAGLWLTSKDFYAGYSVSQPFNYKVDLNNYGSQSIGSKLVLHQVVTAGVKLPVTESFALIPSAFYRITKGVPGSADFTLRAAIGNSFYLSGGYRTTDAFIAQAGIVLLDNLMVGYSYDANVSALNTTARGGHEITVGYRFKSANASPQSKLYW